MPDRPIILTLTKMAESGLDTLRAAGELRFASSLDPAVLHREIAPADALVIRTAGTIDAALMDAAPRLVVIGRHGVGYDQVDVPAATARGIQVVYTPGANTEAVAEHALAFMIGLSKQFPLHMSSLVEGRYDDRTKYVGRDLAGRRIGIVGFGRIGKRIGELAKVGFGMEVLYCDVVAPPAEAERRAGARRVELDELLIGVRIRHLARPARRFHAQDDRPRGAGQDAARRHPHQHVPGTRRRRGGCCRSPRRGATLRLWGGRL